MTIEHVIVVRVRGGRIILSADELRMTTRERLRWVSERGKPFRIKFKEDRAPFGNNGVHATADGVIQVVPVPGPGMGPPTSTGPGPSRTVCPYAVQIDGLPELDPKIVFEIPPDDRRDGGGG